MISAAIRRDHQSGRLQEVIAEYEELSESSGDRTVFVALLPADRTWTGS